MWPASARSARLSATRPPITSTTRKVVVSARTIHSAREEPARRDRAGHRVMVSTGAVQASPYPDTIASILLGEREPIAFVTITDSERALAFYRTRSGWNYSPTSSSRSCFESDGRTPLAKAIASSPRPGRCSAGESRRGQRLAELRSRRCATRDGPGRAGSGLSERRPVAWFSDPDGNVFADER